MIEWRLRSTISLSRTQVKEERAAMKTLASSRKRMKKVRNRERERARKWHGRTHIIIKTDIVTEKQRQIYTDEGRR